MRQRDSNTTLKGPGEPDNASHHTTRVLNESQTYKLMRGVQGRRGTAAHMGQEAAIGVGVLEQLEVGDDGG